MDKHLKILPETVEIVAKKPVARGVKMLYHKNGFFTG